MKSMTLMQVITQFWWAVLSSMVGIVLLINYWDKVKWWWMNTWYAFPLFGKLSRLARDDTRDSSHAGWLKSERTLCADYAKFIGVKSKIEFDRYNSYLERSGDLGRKPLSLFMWLLIIALVIVEAMGFSYVLAGYTVPGASEAMQTYGAMGIAFLVSVILVAFTHYTGHELYQNGKINEARQEWRDAGKKGQLTYKTSVSLANNHEDDDKPHFTQMAHRVGKTPKHVLTILTAVFVLGVAVGATYVRGVVLEKQLTAEVAGTQSNYFGVPKDLADVASAAETKALQDTQNLDREGGWSTFIVLAVIFVFLQILGVILGYKYGFAGLESSHAFKGLGHGRFHTYDEVRHYVEEIVSIAQARLETLQQRLEEHNSLHGNQGVDTNKSFRNYLLEDALEKDSHNQQHEAIGQSKIQESPVKVSPAPAAPAVEEDEEIVLQKELEAVEKQNRVNEMKRKIAEAKGEAV
jgi:hypothetical protein